VRAGTWSLPSLAALLVSGSPFLRRFRLRCSAEMGSKSCVYIAELRRGLVGTPPRVRRRVAWGRGATGAASRGHMGGTIFRADWWRTRVRCPENRTEQKRRPCWLGFGFFGQDKHDMKS
jgi:hypothetical protein